MRQRWGCSVGREGGGNGKGTVYSVKHPRMVFDAYALGNDCVNAAFRKTRQLQSLSSIVHFRLFKNNLI